MRVLLLTPPMTQLNTPYPATAYLTGFLRGRKLSWLEAVEQADPALELILRLLSRQGLTEIKAELEIRYPKHARSVPEPVTNFLSDFARYRDSVEPVIRFLQGKDPSLALRIASRSYLPEGPRFGALHIQENEAQAEGGPGYEDPLYLAFGSLGVQDRAKYLASLYIDDLADVIRQGVDSRFELSRYGEKLAASSASFDPLFRALTQAPSLVDDLLDSIVLDLLRKHRPDVLGLTAPFPGNVYAAFRIAQVAKHWDPRMVTILGGGYVNTELRELEEPRVFDFFDYLTLDDGERPFLSILEKLQTEREKGATVAASMPLLRTYVREEGKVVLKSSSALHDIPHRDAGTPSYDGLPIDRYLSIFEMLNPMHRLWSDGRWNKLTLAHGCYWKKCNFCDITLDYIGRYDPASADLLVDRIEKIVAETGQSGFHFVDEAAPPAVLRALAEKLIERGVTITWWGNIRFEKTFTPELTELLARSGCVAVSGGLEVASDRLLKLMNKGVTVEQVARVTRAFSEAGVLVHAYLMYGFPTQTEQETVDALERVRQLFAEGCIHSAYWHRFSTTVHSPIGRDPKRFGIELREAPLTGPRFARNDLPFEDPTAVDHEMLGEGLRKALYNFLHGVGLDADVRFWFDQKVPRAKVPASLIANALRGGDGGKSRRASDQR